jgi:hypothetical protein
MFSVCVQSITKSDLVPPLCFIKEPGVPGSMGGRRSEAGSFETVPVAEAGFVPRGL